MAAGKIFAISFAINAIMGGRFAQVIGQSSTAMKKLEERLIPADRTVIPVAATNPRAGGGDPFKQLHDYHAAELIPAQAGVIPGQAYAGADTDSIPRAGGGDPARGKKVP